MTYVWFEISDLFTASRVDAEVGMEGLDASEPADPYAIHGRKKLIE